MAVAFEHTGGVLVLTVDHAVGELEVLQINNVCDVLF